MSLTKLSRINALVIEIMSLGYKTNFASDYAVFVDYSGHVNLLYIAIARSKEDYQFKVAQGHFYLDHIDPEQLAIVRDRLRRLLETGDITACGMTAVSECNDIFIL